MTTFTHFGYGAKLTQETYRNLFGKTSISKVAKKLVLENLGKEMGKLRKPEDEFPTRANIKELLKGIFVVKSKGAYFIGRLRIIGEKSIPHKEILILKTLGIVPEDYMTVVFGDDAKIVNFLPEKSSKEDVKEDVKEVKEAKEDESEESMDFSDGIKIVLSQIHGSDYTLTKKTMKFVNKMLNKIGQKIVDKTTPKKGEISSSDIQDVIRKVLPGGLLKHAVSEGTKATTKFTATGVTGLHFPTNLKFKTSKKFSETASIYLAAVLEYLSAEILDISGNVARCLESLEKVRISHVKKAIEDDEEFSEICKDF